jgi:hypothetical protein
MDLQNHFGRASEQKLRARLHALTLDVGKDILCPGGLEHVVHEADASARVDSAQRPGLPLENEHGPGTRSAGHTSPHLVEIALDPCGEPGGFFRAAYLIAQPANRERNVGQSGVLVAEYRHFRTCQP